MKSIWYIFIKLLIKTSLFFYTKKITVVGKDNIPKKGAVLFAINHPNGLIDPLIATTNINRKTHYLVRAASFKNKWVKRFLTSLNLMPIYRIRDGASQLGKNQEIFENCYSIFKKGEALMIFPEGSHNRKRTIRPLSKGFTRIVFGTLNKYPEITITIIPVGLTYQNASYFPAKVAVHFGKPILVNTFYKKESVASSAVNLKNELSDGLKKLSVHIEDDTNYKTTLNTLNAAQVDFTNVQTVNKLVKDYILPTSKKPKKNWLKPLYFILLINSILPVIIWKILSKKIDEIEFVDTFRFAVNTLTFSLFYGIQTCIVAFLFNAKIALAYLFISLLLVVVYAKLAPTNTECALGNTIS